MKIGPFHITWDRLYQKQIQLAQKIAELQAAVQRNDPIASASLAHLNDLMHSPQNARIASPWICVSDQGDDRANRVVDRVIAAFRNAMAENEAPPVSLWDPISQRKRDFVKAMSQGDRHAVFGMLSRMFQSDLIWGLGNVHESHPDLLRSYPKPNFLHLKFTDSVVNLAEAVGATRVPNAEQNLNEHMTPLNVDLDNLVKRTEAASGLRLSFPKVGGAYGWKVANQFVTIDSLTHSYSVYRLLQIGATSNTRVVEIGGGYGCMANLMHRGGLTNYEIYDLPWVNALQGYFLIMSLGEENVRLFGETEKAGVVSVLPHWLFTSLPADSVNIVINTDSMPEMGSAATKYVEQIYDRLSAHGVFYSINQEAMAEILGIGPQNHVHGIVRKHGGYDVRSRHRFWMRRGYVEEIFAPKK